MQGGGRESEAGVERGRSATRQLVLCCGQGRPLGEKVGLQGRAWCGELEAEKGGVCPPKSIMANLQLASN